MRAKRVAYQHSKPATAGFTIIELFMVLAIAGFIMLLVFQAIPTLQRNSRNSQRKQDVATILSAVSRYQLNNSGKFPACTLGQCDIGGNFLSGVQSNLSQIEALGVIAESRAPGGAPHAGVTDLTFVLLLNRYKCDSDNPGRAISTGAGYRDIVALYATEQDDASNTAPQCQQL